VVETKGSVGAFRPTDLSKDVQGFTTPPPVTAPVAAASWEVKAWELITNPKQVKDEAALSALLDNLGVTEAYLLLGLEENDIAEITAFLKKAPRNILLKIFKEQPKSDNDEIEVEIDNDNVVIEAE
jgi:hypothetical protein